MPSCARLQTEAAGPAGSGPHLSRWVTAADGSNGRRQPLLAGRTGAADDCRSGDPGQATALRHRGHRPRYAMVTDTASTQGDL